MSLRRFFYALARFLGDWGAARKGKAGRRLFRRGLGRGVGKWFLSLFN